MGSFENQEALNTLNMSQMIVKNSVKGALC